MYVLYGVQYTPQRDETPSFRNFSNKNPIMFDSFKTMQFEGDAEYVTMHVTLITQNWQAKSMLSPILSAKSKVLQQGLHEKRYSLFI